MASNYGTYRYAVDHKGRVSIPPDWRREGKRPRDRFFIRPSHEGCLELYGESEWAAVEEKLRRKLRRGPNFVAAVRKYIQDAAWVSVDTQGRITIPSALLSRAGLGKEAVLHGNIDIIEIWNPEQFQIAQTKASPVSEPELLGDD